jgi:hypothetical protein
MHHQQRPQQHSNHHAKTLEDIKRNSSVISHKGGIKTNKTTFGLHPIFSPLKSLIIVISC